MRECVIIDGVRSANSRAHNEKGWFRALRPDEILTKVYDGLFARNPQIKPEEIESVFVGCANITGMQNDIGRLAWLAGGFPESVATNTLTMQCPSGMAATQHAARAILCGEGDTYIAAGVEDMQKVFMAMHMDFAPRLMQRYNIAEIPMGATAEKVAEQWKITRDDMENMAFWSHKKADEATKAGKFKQEIIPIEGLKDDGTPFMVDKDQWIRGDISREQMATMKPGFKPDGLLTAATSSPLTIGAAALLLMERSKADQLGLSYHLKYEGGCIAGCDPTIMGIGPIPAVKKLLDRKGMKINDIDIWEFNEAFASQSLACVRDLGIAQNAPFENVNVWGGALALGHPLGESGCRLVVTMNSIMKTDYPNAKYCVATLCGAFGNAGAIMFSKV
ncbi:MAG TPA: thiolase family protein [Smithellaceae bacterium]|jgi:acetyl-CoA acyltransferase|nr:thiolase family protein [Smithellaceae bacterium]HQM46514.1 thiolase family protein [Smithellaceae bacterium]